MTEILNRTILLTEYAAGGRESCRVNLRGVLLSETNVSGADLAAAFMVGTDLDATDLSTANLRGTIRENTRLTTANYAQHRIFPKAFDGEGAGLHLVM